MLHGALKLGPVALRIAGHTLTIVGMRLKSSGLAKIRGLSLESAKLCHTLPKAGVTLPSDCLKSYSVTLMLLANRLCHELISKP